MAATGNLSVTLGTLALSSTGRSVNRWAVSTGVVAGAFTWDATVGTKWGNASGGTGGFSVPDSLDIVTFNSATSSSTYTATRTGTVGINGLSLAGPASGTLTFNSTSALALDAGGLTVAATGVTATGFTSTITPSASCTFDTNNVQLGVGVTLNSAARTITIASNFRTTGTVNLTAGTLSILTRSFTCAAFTHGSNGTVSLSSGGSLTCTTLSVVGTLSFPSGSTLTATGATITGTLNPSGAFVCSSLSIAAAGILTTGAGYSISINASGSGTALDNAVSAASQISSGTNITVNTGAFSTTLNGGNGNNINLTIANSSSNPTTTVSGTIGSITFSSYTGGIQNTSGLTVLSNFTIPSTVTWSGSGTLTVNNTLTTNGVVLSGTLIVGTISGNVQTTGTLIVYDNSSTTIGANTLTAQRVLAQDSGGSGLPALISISGGRLVLTGSGVVNDISLGGGMTFPNPGSVMEFTTGTTRTLTGANSANLTVINSNGTLSFVGNGVVPNHLVGTIQAATGTITIQAGTTLSASNFTLSSCTLNSGTAGTQATISKSSGTVTFTNMTIKDINATGGATFNAVGCVNGGNNTGINFLSASTGNFFALLM